MASRKVSGPSSSGASRSLTSTNGPTNGSSLLSPTTAPEVPKRPGLLRGLRRPKGTEVADFSKDYAHALDAHFASVAGYSPDVFGDHGILAEEQLAQKAVASGFPGFDDMNPDHVELAWTLTNLKAPTGQPFSNGVTLTAVLSAVTRGDTQTAPDRALAALRHWHNPEQADVGTQADIFEAHCLLAETPLGWRVLEQMAPSPWAKLTDTDEERLRMTTALQAAGHLIRNASPVARPTNLEEASEFASHVLSSDNPAFEQHVVAARTLIAMQSDNPTPEQCEATFLFRTAGVAETTTLSNVRKKVRGIFGRAGQPPGWIKRVFAGEPFPITEQRLKDALVQQIMGGISKHARSGLPADGKTPVPLTEEAIKDAACVAKMSVMSDRIDRKGFRAPMKIGRLAEGKIQKATAELLHIDEKTLENHPAWKAVASDISEPLDIEPLTSMAHSRKLDVDSELGKTISALTRLEEGLAPRAEGFAGLLADMKPGSEMEFTSGGIRAVNVTGWMNIVADALSYIPWVPSATPLPTVAKTRGSESSVSLRGEEGPDGSHFDITIRSVDRSSRTRVMGLVAQWVIVPKILSFYVVGEGGRHKEEAKGEVVTIRVTGEKGETFEEVKARTVETVNALARGSWKGLVEHAWVDPHVSVIPGSVADRAKASFALVTAVGAVNVPYHPTQGWVGVAPQVGVSRGNRSARHAGAADVTSFEEDIENSRGLFGLSQNAPALPAGTHQSPGGALSATYGLGAYFHPLKKNRNILLSRNVTLSIDDSGRVFRQVTMDPKTYEKWRANQGGASVLTPPLAPDLALPPDAPLTRGERRVQVKQYATPEEQRKLTDLLDLAKTVSAAGGDVGLMGAAMREAMANEDSWGDYDITEHRTMHAQKNTGMKAAYVVLLQAMRGIKVRSSEPISAPVGPNRLNGTTPLERLTPPEHHARLVKRNEPTRFAPAAPGFRRSPMQEQLRGLFSRYPKTWQVEPKLVPTHADTYGDLFKLVQLRTDIHGAHSKTGLSLREFFGSDDSIAFITCVPRRDPADIMRDFNKLKADYWFQKTGQLGGENVKIDELDRDSLHIWSDFDLTDFLKENFTRQVPPGEPWKYEPYPAVPLGAHIERMREVNATDMRFPPKGASTRPLPYQPQPVPSRRFWFARYGWDSIPTVKGLLAAGRFDRARICLDNDAAEIEETGEVHNGNETQYSGRVQPMSFTLNVGDYATAMGSDSHLVPYLQAMMIEYRNRQRGAGDITAGQIFNGVAMMPDGGIVLRNRDYADGPRPEGFVEDVRAARKALAEGIDPEFVYAHYRQSAASGIDMSVAHDNPVDGRPELPFMGSLQENAHLVQAEKVIIRALKAAGHHDMAGQVQQIHDLRIQTLRKAFIQTMPDGSVKVGAYLRLHEDELHPLDTAEIANALWAGIATKEETPEAVEAIEQMLDRLTTPGGVGSTAADLSHEQWDSRKRLWAMHSLKTVEGYERVGEHDKAKAMAIAFTEGAWATYVLTGHTFEKNGFDGTPGGGGEYKVEADMTMTNEALAYFASRYPECQAILDRPMQAESTVQHLRDYQASVHAYQDARGLARSDDDPLNLAIVQLDFMAQQQRVMTERMRSAFVSPGGQQPPAPTQAPPQTPPTV
jgi:alpha,alpha-trehalase